MANSYPHKQWMSETRYMDRLSIGEIVWPGAHNSGVDRDASYPLHIAAISNWVVCQDGPFIQQLNEGVRALDLRFHADEHWMGIKKFHTFHGPATGRSLSELIKSLKYFLNENPDEFIILDLHELKTLNGDAFDYKTFNTVIMNELGLRLIPEKNKSLTLGELKKLSRQQRIVLAAAWHPDFNSPLYWGGISHQWSGTDITPPNELKQHIARTLKSPPSGAMPWSLSATSYELLVGVKRITTELNEWFGPTSGWAPKCSIINVDFFGDSSLIDYCWESNMIKGRAKH
ncbi:phospholipase [Pseudomonas frederiksbergensis]|uniref:1-phosphatidylinositol phosphodiesterase n=1 Tax=Pseudomonas frederiksbergensis TaxID=104087 RepID=A0A1J0ET65_9PSED|nr:phospholipase [Pseudomonas frederiksbergensis]APC19000.1 phospholipase [Pseudomonas frederiksbergensis]